MSTKEKLIQEWIEKFLPPVGIKPTGGEQLPSGNSYPNVDEIDAANHIAGHKTFAPDIAYIDGTGHKMCKAGVFDIDEKTDVALETARNIAIFLNSKGITTLISCSGRKGYHVTIISEPVIEDIMIKALAKTHEKFQFKGELIPSAASRRCKNAPCVHRVSNNWSYYFEENEAPTDIARDQLPENFHEEQLKILQQAKPTKANILTAFAISNFPQAHTKINDDNIIPDFSNLSGAIPPCVNKLITKGGSSAIGTYDKNNLCLATFCNMAKIPDKNSNGLALELAKNSVSGNVETGKNQTEKIRHFKSIKGTPSAKNPFRCSYMLQAKKDLQFSCSDCPARPVGIKIQGTPNEHSEKFELELQLAKDLIVYVLNKGLPTAHVSTAIFPYFPYKTDIPELNDPENSFKIIGLIYDALSDGCNTTAKLARWFDSNSWADYINDTLQNRLNKYPLLIQKFINEVKNKIINIFEVWRKEDPVSEEEYNIILHRAVTLTAKYQIHKNTKRLGQDICKPGSDIYTLVSDNTYNNMTVLTESQGNTLKTMGEDAESLLGYLRENKKNLISTPFPTLNYLLGGGLRNGNFYVVVAQPGGGKTTLCSEISDFAASNGVPVIYVAMEMGRPQLFVYSLARLGEINSAKVEGFSRDNSKVPEQTLADTANDYFEKIGFYMWVIEGDHNTTCAKLEVVITNVRAKLQLADDAPVLVVLDYLQLLATGNDKLDINSHETPKISELAVSAKQLARNKNVAVLAISDVTKDEQGKSLRNQELTLNSLRGSNRIAHAADCVMALYSEQAKHDGGKADTDPWTMFTDKIKDSDNAIDFVRSLETIREEITLGGDGATVLSRLEILKNRGGHGKGNQLMLYKRAYHKFEAIEVEGQAKAEGRG